MTIPGVWGEGIVMRLLDKEQVLLSMDTLGIAGDSHDRFEPAFRQSYGAILVTGPTGSGKSTTLYAALNAINSPEKNIITIEDPVEYQLAGINQIQVNLKAGLGFAQGLRSMLRADPDIIMVGEIRDARDRADRGRVGPHGPPRPLDASHQRRPVRDHPPDRDGHRAVPHRVGGGLHRRPAARAQAVHPLQEARRPQPGVARGAPASRRTSTSRPTSPPAARAATTPATRAGSASTR